MKEEKLIHIKLVNSEAVQAKRDFLGAQAETLVIARTIKTYGKLRNEELKSKAKLYRKLKELKTNLNKLNQTLPKIEIPKILNDTIQEQHSTIKKIQEPQIEKTIAKAKKPKPSDSLEQQLQEIQDRLNSLE